MTGMGTLECNAANLRRQSVVDAVMASGLEPMLKSVALSLATKIDGDGKVNVADATADRLGQWNTRPRRQQEQRRVNTLIGLGVLVGAGDYYQFDVSKLPQRSGATA